MLLFVMLMKEQRLRKNILCDVIQKGKKVMQNDDEVALRGGKRLPLICSEDYYTLQSE